MNSLLLKALIGIGSVGVTTAASVGGYYWLSAPSTIRKKIKNKTLLKPYSENGSNEEKKPWTDKKTKYTENAANVDASILSASDVTEKKISDECQKILATPLNSEDTELKKKEEWAKNWCFA